MPPGELAANPFGEGAPAPVVAPRAPVPQQAAPAPAGGSVHFFDEYGEFREADASQAPAIVAGGGRIASPEEAKKALLDKRYGGLGSALAAGGEGVARGLSLGASDPLAVGAARLFGGDKTAESVREHLHETKEAHPYAAGAGELAGAAAPVLLSGGAAAPEEAAALGGRVGAGALGAADEAGVISSIASGVKTLGGLPRSVDYLGEAAEHAVSGMLGTTADSAIGRAAQAAARSASRGIVEGGLFGAGQEVSDATLENTPLTSESVLASVGHGALMGGALGFGLGAAGSLASDAAGSLLGKAGDTLQDAAHEQTWKWLDPSKAASKEAEARAGGAAEVGRTVFDEVLKPLVEKDGLAAAAINPEEKLALVQKALDRKGRAIGELIEGNADANVPLGDILKPIDDRIKEWGGKILGEDKVTALQNLRDSVTRILAPPEADLEKLVTGRYNIEGAQVPIGKAIEQRRALQQIAFQEAKSLDPKMRVQLLRDVTSEWNNLEETALNKATEASGGIAGTQLRELNKDFQRLKIAEKALTENTARYQANNTFSLGDKLFAASEMGGAIASGHPLAALGAPVVAMGHKLLREHGNAYSAILLDRLATYGGVSAAARETEKATEGALDKFMAGKGDRGKPGAFRVQAKGRTPPPTGNDNERRFTKEEDRVRQIAALAPGLAGAHLKQRTQPIAMHAPALAQGVQQAGMTANKFLASKLPPSPLASAGASLTPQLAKPQTSPAERAKFLRYVDAVNGGPPAILKRLADGKLTPEDVETFKAVYPASYEDVRTKVAQRCAGRKTPLSYMQRVQLGTLFDLPTDPTLEQPFVMSMQAGYIAQNKATIAANAMAAHGGGSGGGSSKAPSFVSSYASMFGGR